MPTGTILNARQAISRHIQWKITLQLAIQMQEPLSQEALDQIWHHRTCPIGRWLESPATAAMRTSAPYFHLAAKHLEFHREMGHISNLIKDGQFVLAAAAIQSGSAFDRCSKALALAIHACDSLNPLIVSV